MKKAIIAIAFAAMLALGLAGCGNSSSGGGEAPAQDAGSAAPASDTSGDAPASDASSAAPAADATKDAASVVAEAGGWTFAYTGTSDTGEAIYYAEDPTSTYGILVIDNNGTYKVIVGYGDPNSETRSTVLTDLGTGETISLTVVDVSEDQSELTLKIEGHGTATFVRCSVDDVLAALSSAA